MAQGCKQSADGRNVRCLEDYLHSVEAVDAADGGWHWTANPDFQAISGYNCVNSLFHLLACPGQAVEFRVLKVDDRHPPAGREITLCPVF